MASKKTVVKLDVKAKKEPVKTVKASVKAAGPAKKVVVNKISIEKKLVRTAEAHEKVQTAEGWKRMMKKSRELNKKL